MTELQILANKIFRYADQERFAGLSGDHNPMHMDALAARRTQAGALVVHGIHLVLWALDELASLHRDLATIARIKVQFQRFVYVDDEVSLVLMQRDENAIRLDICTDNITSAKVVLSFGEPKQTNRPFNDKLEPVIVGPPRDLSLDQLKDRSGLLSFAEDRVGECFPAATKWIGAPRIAALAASSTLIGMICPGLHSIYGALTLDNCVESMPPNALAFRVVSADERFRLIEQEVMGGGWVGTVTSVLRVPPVVQPTMKPLSRVIQPKEFSDDEVLIIGGSRGLGELTAKIVAAGGAKVTITYRVGKVDAERVAQEIEAGGGSCDVLAYDTQLPAANQLARLTANPTHVYYFATPKIFHQYSSVFCESRFCEFIKVYAEGFWHLIKALHTRGPNIKIFYPSSVAVSTRPKGMTEYAMAKAAGEVLCTELNEAFAPLRVSVSRLPRMATDQTVSMVQAETSDAVETMVPIVRELHLTSDLNRSGLKSSI